jgi:hypothetical protein
MKSLPLGLTLWLEDSQYMHKLMCEVIGAGDTAQRHGKQSRLKKDRGCLFLWCDQGRHLGGGSIGWNIVIKETS